jgi:mRNA-degrading endonuclease RelE of RelBE toxin-antitoxin system
VARFKIILTQLARAEIEAIKVFERKKIIAEIERHLNNDAHIASATRKCLLKIAPSFAFVPPLWELRVANWRVFYDVDVAGNRVYVRAVRRKQPQQTTEEVVRENDDG